MDSDNESGWIKATPPTIVSQTAPVSLDEYFNRLAEFVGNEEDTRICTSNMNYKS
jgi:hypothetical protein